MTVARRPDLRDGDVGEARPALGDVRRRRQTVEHRLARRVQLIRQARYMGRTKTLFQLLMAAAVANLTLLAQASVARPAHRAPMDAAAGAVLLLATRLALWAIRGAHSRPLRASAALRSGHLFAARARPKLGAFRPEF
jgi:hypothetical protein